MIKTDCVYFQLDRPCKKHKTTGITCAECGDYSSVFADSSGKILIIKLGAKGDVLRTTFILEGLKEKYPKCKITWIVAKGSEDILEGNQYIDRIWAYDDKIFAKLAVESFEASINLDLSPESLALASFTLSKNKLGFTLDSKRRIVCSNKNAEHWLGMSGSDLAKKENDCTYQFWMSKIIGLKRSDYEIVVPLKKDSVKKAEAFRKKHALKGPVVGINPGAGKRWKMKKWTDKGYIDIIKYLAEKNIRVILFGGPEEKNLLEKLRKKSSLKAISAGTDNSMPDFFALLNLCDLLITGDTLALHAALGLKKKVIAIFGPTSSAEIETYSRGIKVVSMVPCVCCYRQDCEVKPNCMELIKPGTVKSAIDKLIRQ